MLMKNKEVKQLQLTQHDTMTETPNMYSKNSFDLQLKFPLSFCTFGGFPNKNPQFPNAMPQEIHRIQQVFQRRMAVKGGFKGRWTFQQNFDENWWLGLVSSIVGRRK